MFPEIYRFTIPALVAVLGWFVAHRFNTYRNRTNKRRDMRVKFLLDAYRKLELAANRKELTIQHKLDFESAMADIQLLGSAQQVEETVACLKQHAAKSNSDVLQILTLLRKDLRKELGISGGVGEPIIFRFDSKT